MCGKYFDLESQSLADDGLLVCRVAFAKTQGNQPVLKVAAHVEGENWLAWFQVHFLSKVILSYHCAMTYQGSWPRVPKECSSQFLSETFQLSTPSRHFRLVEKRLWQLWNSTLLGIFSLKPDNDDQLRRASYLASILLGSSKTNIFPAWCFGGNSDNGLHYCHHSPFTDSHKSATTTFAG